MKTLKLGALMLFMGILAIAFTSCGGYSPKAAEKMVEKCDDDKMKKGDWEQCIEWIEEAYTDQLDAIEECIKQSKDSDQFEEKTDKAQEKFEKKWEDIEDIESMLDNYTNQEDMGKANRKKYEKVKENFQKRLNKLQEKAMKKFDE